MSGECWMRRINTGVQNCDFDRTVWSDAPVNLMSQRQVNLFGRPLRYERSVVAADAPGVAYAPGIAATDGWRGNKIRFNKNNPRIARQRGYAVSDVSVIRNPQSVDRPRAK